MLLDLLISVIYKCLTDNCSHDKLCNSREQIPQIVRQTLTNINRRKMKMENLKKKKCRKSTLFSRWMVNSLLVIVKFGNKFLRLCDKPLLDQDYPK